MKRIPLLVLALTLLLAWSTPLPVGAASKYKACSLLTAAELQAALGAKVGRTDERDIAIDKGPYKGETMSTCTWVMGSIYAMVSVIRAPRTAEERDAGLAKLRGAEDTLVKRGWTIARTNIAGAACATYKPPAGENFPPSAGCMMESKGLAFSLGVNGSARVTVQQVRALAGKVAARLP